MQNLWTLDRKGAEIDTTATHESPRLNLAIIKQILKEGYRENIKRLKGGDFQQVNNLFCILREEEIFIPYRAWYEQFAWTLQNVAKNAHFIAKLICCAISRDALKKSVYPTRYL